MHELTAQDVITYKLVVISDWIRLGMLHVYNMQQSSFLPETTHVCFKLMHFGKYLYSLSYVFKDPNSFRRRPGEIWES